MAIKSQGNPLAIAGSRKKGTEATQTAAGVDITGTDICEEFGHKGSDQTVVGSNIKLGDSYIVWFNEKNNNYEPIKCRDYREEVKAMLKEYNKND